MDSGQQAVDNDSDSIPRQLGHRRRCWRALALALLALLVACEPLQRPEAGDAERLRAEALAEQQRHDDAAEAFLALAAKASGAQRERYLIQAARERRLAGRIGAAQAILDGLRQPVDPVNRLGWVQVAADVAVANGQPRRALEILAMAPPTSKPGAAAELARIRAEALFRLGDPVAATRAYVERELWLDSPAAIAENQALLWAAYQRFGDSISPATADAEDDPLIAGWLRLAYVAATRRDSEAGLNLALLGWQSRHPNHPAARVLLPRLLRDYAGVAQMPEQVALLLPLSGRQEAAGRAIREGFLAAHYAAADLGVPRPTIRIYDAARQGVLAASRAAAADGAQFIVGPLLKPSAQELAGAGSGLPTLALNYLPDDLPPPASFYQFALAPEDEAQAVADRAVALHQWRALVLAPNNPLGRRLLNSFAARYEGQGGRILAYRFYAPEATDFSNTIKDLLLINESEARHARLSANLGVALGFAPRRRADIDLIFLIATPDAGKLIRPQLRFHYAGDVPTYATSAIWREGSRNNADLNGILLPALPWLVTPNGEQARARDVLAEFWPQEVSRARLHAMGFDAWSLLPELIGGTLARGAELAGATGRLYLAADGRIHRRLGWAHISGGRLERLPPLNAVDAAQEVVGRATAGN